MPFRLTKWLSLLPYHTVLFTENGTPTIISFSPYLTPSIPLFAEFNVLPISSLLQYANSVLRYKLLNKLINLFRPPPPRVSTCLRNTTPTRFSQNDNAFSFPVRTNYGNHVFRYFVPTGCNNIPSDIKNVTALLLFKTDIKHFIINNRA